MPTRLVAIENDVFLDLAGERTRGEPDPTRENTSPELPEPVRATPGVNFDYSGFALRQ